MIKAAVFSLIAGIGGLWIATTFIPGVTFTGSWQTLLILGVILGIIILIVKPLLNFISFLLRILILGGVIFAIIWVLGLVFPQFVISGILPMVYTAIAVAGLTIIFSIF